MRKNEFSHYIWVAVDDCSSIKGGCFAIYKNRQALYQSILDARYVINVTSMDQPSQSSQMHDPQGFQQLAPAKNGYNQLIDSSKQEEQIKEESLSINNKDKQSRVQEQTKKQAFQEKIEQQDSQSSLQDQGQIIKAQIQYHYQDRNQQTNSVQQQHSQEFTNSPHLQSSNSQPNDENSNKLDKPKQQNKNNKDSPAINKKRKIKKGKKNYKCSICKISGKKGEMIKCRKCKQYLHVNCLDQNQLNQQKNDTRYVCQKCEFQEKNKPIQKVEQLQVINLQGEQKEVEANQQVKQQLDNYMNRMDRMFIDKLSCNKRTLNRFDKRNYQFRIFKQRYPYYVQGDKIKYPVDDRLMIIYADLLQVQDKRVIPPTDHPIIPSQHLGDLLQIQNWLISFNSLIKVHFPQCILPLRHNKEYLFQSMKQQGYDEAFFAILNVILRIYLADIFDTSRKQNMKMLSQHSFFSILSQLKQSGDMNDQFLATSAQEILMQLSNVPSFKVVLKNVLVPSILNIASKCHFVISLLKGLTETYGFKLLATKKTEVIQQLIDRKGKLIARIKQAQTGKLQNREKIKEYEDLMQQEEGFVDVDETSNKKKSKQGKQKNKQKQKAKKKISQIQNQNSLTQSELVQIKDKLNQCLKALQFATTEILFLGKDRNGSEFYYSRYQPHRLYVNYKKFLCENKKAYKMYEGKKKILQISRNLNCKGINQKRLNHQMNILTKLNMIQDNIEIQEGEQYNINVMRCSIDRMFIIKYFKEIQTQISSFYKQRAMQWASHQQRIKVMRELEQEQDINKIAAIILSIQEMFLNVQTKFIDPIKAYKKAYGINFQTELKMSNTNKARKIAMRIWGANPEKLKKYWCDYLTNSPNLISIWVCLYTLKLHIDKFIKRKIQAQETQRRKNLKQQKLKTQRKKYNVEEGNVQEASRTMGRLRRNVSYRQSYDQASDTEKQIHQKADNKPECKELSQLQNSIQKKSLRSRKMQVNESQSKRSDQQPIVENKQQNNNEERKKKKNKEKRSIRGEQQSQQKSSKKKKHKHKHKHKHKEHKEQKQQQQQKGSDNELIDQAQPSKEKSNQKETDAMKQKKQKKNSKAKNQKERKDKTVKKRNKDVAQMQQSSQKIAPSRNLRQRKLTLQSQSSFQQSDKEKMPIQNQVQNQQVYEENSYQSSQQLSKQQIVLCVLCSAGEEGNTFVICFECRQSYHMSCANLNRKPKTQWICSKCTNKTPVRLTRRSKR